ncbi:hypothetical protein ACIF6L_34525 [Kitasatospora sp. NPDC086009]|uniref:hypothetical protein n=1 Tax=unclassified Kitasatospora TaxID=2633591 RepID=UPI0037C6A4D8
MSGNRLPVLAGVEVIEGELVEDDDQALVQFALPGVDAEEPLTAEAAEDLADSRPERTSTTYNEQWRYFERWCAAEGRRPGPRTEETTMVSYISHLRRHGGRDRTGAPVSSLRLAMAAIRDRNADAGFAKWPPTRAANALIRKQAARFAAEKRVPRSSPPVDRARVAELQAGVTASSELARYRDLVILHLGYRTRARRSEQAAYRIDSIAFVMLADGGEEMIVGKRTSKNDHWSTGKEYTVRDRVAIAVVRRYLELLAEYGQADPEMPLLRGITPKGGLMPVPKTGIGLSGHAVNRALKRMIARTPDFDAPTATSHGLRAGVPADLGAQGYSGAEILAITDGDWASEKMATHYAKSGARRGGRGNEGQAQQALDALTIAAPPDDGVGAHQ